MERLNDIMGRATQRRQHYSDPQSLQGAQEQRPPQQSTQQRPSRPLREQNARQGQQRPYVPQSQPLPPKRSYSGGPTNIPESREGRSYGTSAARPLYPRSTQQNQQRSATNGPTAYPQQHSESQRPQSPQPLHPLQTRPIHAYRHSDDYAVSPMIQADVIGEWEEDEDGTTGMQYGDWEEEDESEIVIYRRANVEPTAPPRQSSTGYPQHDYQQDLSYPQHPLVTRQLSRVSDTGIQGHATHNLRDVQIPAAQPQPPMPQARTHEIQQPQRMTQPLEPRVVAETGKERLPPQEPPSQPMQQRPLRQIVPQRVREQAVQPYASVALPSPAISRGVCPKCNGAGYLRIDVPFGHPNFGKPVACECKEAEKKQKRRQQLLELSDLDAFHNKSFKNFSTRFPGVHPSVHEAFQESYRFAQDPDGWLLLVGPNGCGKTHLAASIANQSLNDGAVVLFTVVPDLLAHLRSTFAPTSTEAYDQRFSKMREAELLVLDDLGAHQGSPWANEKLFQLLNYRYNSGYPTVITANKQGLASVDERILSRLSDTGLVTSIVLNGAQDYRRQNPRREPTR